MISDEEKEDIINFDKLKTCKYDNCKNVNTTNCEYCTFCLENNINKKNEMDVNKKEDNLNMLISENKEDIIECAYCDKCVYPTKMLDKIKIDDKYYSVCDENKVLLYNKIMNEKNNNYEFLNNENKDLIIENSNAIDNSKDIYDDESEPENEYDYEDPHFLKYPDEFMCHNCYETNVEKGKLFDFAQEMIYKSNDLEKEKEKLDKNNIDKDKIINVYKKENAELKNIINREENKYMDFINNLNDNFMELFLNTHESFDYIKDILLTLEKTNPKKVPEILNKNIKKYKEDIQNIANEANKVRKNHIKISNDKFGDKIKIVD